LRQHREHTLQLPHSATRRRLFPRAQGRAAAPPERPGTRRSATFAGAGPAPEDGGE